MEDPLSDFSPGVVTKKIKEIIEKLDIVSEHLDKAVNALDKVDASGLDDYGTIVTFVKDTLDKISSTVKIFEEQKDLFLYLLGDGTTRKFLLIYQNPAEIRATGGFIGSFSVLEMKDGHFSTPEVVGVYDVDNQLTEEIIPPKPLQHITGAWSMHDANWFLDFPTSAKQIMLFYEKTGGPTVDGVIAINTEILRSFLEISGPIYLEDFGMSIDAYNFKDLIQDEVETSGAQGNKQPKRILSVMFPKLLNKILEEDPSSLIYLPSIINNHFSKRDIMLYATDEERQNEILNLHWGGQIVETGRDYLAIVHSNIGGAKSDRVMKDDASLSVEVQEDGSIVNELILKRKHEGEGSLYVWLEATNRDYLRLYVPYGSKVLSAEGFSDLQVVNFDYGPYNFERSELVQSIESTIQVEAERNMEIFQESNKSVFAGWVITEAGKENIVKIRYKLPFTLEKLDQYSFYNQRQSGLNESDFSFSFNPGQYQILRKEALDTDLIGNDYYSGYVLKR
jgi:hypothetical protein